MFYSRRKSVTGYLYAYSLTEEQPFAGIMQRELISEVENANPDYLVFVEDWVIRPKTDTGIIEWYRQYVVKNFDLVGVMRVNDGFHLRSAEETQMVPGTFIAAILVYQRKPHSF